MDMITEMREKRRIAYVLADMLTLVDESLDGTRRVKRIVTDLKTFSRLDRDEIGFIDINETIELAINMIWNEFKHKASIERSYQELPQVRCNAQKISQVFINLLLNAVQAVEREGIVRVATSYGSTGLASGKDRVEIAVSDNGCGIPSECLPKIFDPFFTTKDPGKGTGLGLSIVYDIVQGHRGEIRVESEEGVGSTFTVSLPVENVCS
jgi:two-component system NtrC family sensor kinase